MLLIERSILQGVLNCSTIVVDHQSIYHYNYYAVSPLLPIQKSLYYASEN